MKHLTKIAFMHAENGHNDKGISRGITQYVRKKGSWQLIPWPDCSLESLSFLKKQGCQGAIVNVQTYSKAKQFLEVGIPIVAYSTLQDMGQVPFISTDSRQVTKLAFEYLSMKQFEHYAFFGLTQARWTQERLEYFSEFINKSGYSLHLFQGKPVEVTNDLTSFIQLWIDATLKCGQQELISWLTQLPKPTAILSSCDILGCHLSHFSKEANLRIPDDIAILGIDNNEALCNICTPPLSSISLNLNKAGYDAAELLDKIISGKAKMEGQRIKIQPMHVKERASTDIFAIQDEDVILALKYIRSQSREPIQVGEVADHICVSKRSLQMKFQQLLNKSIHEEIIHAHFLNARTLLLETDLPIEEIALKSGFHYSSKMRRAFQDITGLLPHKYREIYRSV